MFDTLLIYLYSPTPASSSCCKNIRAVTKCPFIYVEEHLYTDQRREDKKRPSFVADLMSVENLIVTNERIA